MSTINLLFWNGDQARLRAGWRLLVYSALWFTLGYVAIYLRNTVLAGRLPEVYRTPFFFFSSRRRHTVSLRDWSSDVCSSDLLQRLLLAVEDADLVGAHLGRPGRR